MWIGLLGKLFALDWANAADVAAKVAAARAAKAMRPTDGVIASLPWAGLYATTARARRGAAASFNDALLFFLQTGSRRGFSRRTALSLNISNKERDALSATPPHEPGHLSKSEFRIDDVLFGKLRAYLRKYWLATCEGVCSTEIWVLSAKPSMLIPQYLFQLVTLDRFIEAARSAYGTCMPRSDWNVVKNFKVTLPKLAEQAAIAAVLSDMDAELAALEAKPPKPANSSEP